MTDPVRLLLQLVPLCLPPLVLPTLEGEWLRAANSPPLESSYDSSSFPSSPVRRGAQPAAHSPACSDSPSSQRPAAAPWASMPSLQRTESASSLAKLGAEVCPQLLCLLAGLCCAQPHCPPACLTAACIHCLR